MIKEVAYQKLEKYRFPLLLLLPWVLVWKAVFDAWLGPFSGKNNRQRRHGQHGTVNINRVN
jgi:hypothetical protein